MDREIVKILVHELEFGKRVSTADVLFSYVVRQRFPEQTDHIKDFHTLAEDIVQLSKRRNDLVHSNYSRWIDIMGREGLVRSNSKFKPSKSTRLDIDEDLLPESFSKDHEEVAVVIRRLERFRLLLIEWHYPDVD
jgi:alpha-D-ribose 1-methylphosphonate 5-triphosphate synthase subunit PhnI